MLDRILKFNEEMALSDQILTNRHVNVIIEVPLLFGLVHEDLLGYVFQYLLLEVNLV